MSFKATVAIDGGAEIRLLHASYSLRRDVDATGRPSTGLYGGTIQLEIESTDDTSIYEWICDQVQRKNGTVKFYKRDSDSKMKELKFEEAYIVNYSESFDSIGENPMGLSFVLSAKKLTLGGGTHENEWPK